MKRNLAVAGSIAALSLAAVPIAAAAGTPHHKANEVSRVDRSRDKRGDRADRSRDVKSVDRSRDLRDI
jgi:hypothetical protein